MPLDRHSALCRRRFLFAPQVVWPILGIGFRFLLPAFLPLQAVYTALVVACNGHLYTSLQVGAAPPDRCPPEGWLNTV